MISKGLIHDLLFKTKNKGQRHFHLDLEQENALDLALSLFFDFGKKQKLLLHFKEDETVSLALGCALSVDNREDLGKLKTPFFGGASFSSSTGSDPIWKDIPHRYFFHPKLLVTIGKKRVDLQSFVETEELMELFDESSSPKEERLNLSPVKEEEGFEKRIKKGIEDVHALNIDKVVLSSYVELSVSSLRSYIEALFKKNTNCHHFLFEKEESLVFSFSPETLLHVEDSRLSTVAMAGSILNEEDDALLKSEKIITENAYVLNYLKGILDPLVDNLEISEQKIARLHNIKHLYHDLSGHLKPNVNPLNLLFLIHPTPALCGIPKDESMRYIEQNENFKRMWYGGALGKVDEKGLHFMVGIRLGVARHNKIRLHAGAGLTEDSLSKTECKEIRRKMLFGQI